MPVVAVTVTMVVNVSEEAASGGATACARVCGCLCDCMRQMMLFPHFVRCVCLCVSQNDC